MRYGMNGIDPTRESCAFRFTFKPATGHHSSASLVIFRGGSETVFYWPENQPIFRPWRLSRQTQKTEDPQIQSAPADVQPIAPALAELLNPAINRGESASGSQTGLQPPPENRGSGAPAASRSPPCPCLTRVRRVAEPTRCDRNMTRTQGARHSPLAAQPPAARRDDLQGFDGSAAGQLRPSAVDPTMDPELAKQLGALMSMMTTRWRARRAIKWRPLASPATADALENLIPATAVPNSARTTAA